MVELFLQDALVRRLETVTADYLMKGKQGERKPVKIFKQWLPLPPSVKVKPKGEKTIEYQPIGEPDYENNFPCVIVKLNDGEIIGGIYTLNVDLLVGAFDNNPDCQGFGQVVNLISKIKNDLLERPLIEKKYKLQPPLKWKLYEENYWPVFYGLIGLKFETGVILERLNAGWVQYASDILRAERN